MTFVTSESLDFKADKLLSSKSGSRKGAADSLNTKPCSGYQGSRAAPLTSSLHRVEGPKAQEDNDARRKCEEQHENNYRLEGFILKV